MRPNPAILALVSLVAVIAASLAMAALLDLPPGWFSLDGWRGLPPSQKLWWGLGTLVLSGLGTVLALTLLGRAARPST